MRFFIYEQKVMLRPFVRAHVGCQKPRGGFLDDGLGVIFFEMFGAKGADAVFLDLRHQLSLLLCAGVFVQKAGFRGLAHTKLYGDGNVAHRLPRFIVGKLKVRIAKCKNIFCRICQRDSGERLCFSREDFFDFWNLVDIDMRIGKTVDILVRFISGRLRDHHGERRILDHVRREPHRYVAGALKHMKRELAVYDADVDPAVTRADHDLLLFSFSADRVLRHPRRDEMRAQMRQFDNLLNDIFKLVVRPAFVWGKIRNSRAVGAGPQIPGRKPALLALFFRAPRRPKFTAERFELCERSRAVYEADDLSDRLLPETLDATLRDHREAVVELEVERRRADERERVGRKAHILALDPYAMLKNIPQEIF